MRLHATVGVQVGDAAEGLAAQWNPDALKLLDGVRHEPFAAGLVDGTGTAVDDDGVQSGAGGVDRRGQSGRPAAGDEQIDHANLANAEFSMLMRLRSSRALRTVKVSAVIHAPCTRGSAMPSATTAT